MSSDADAERRERRTKRRLDEASTSVQHHDPWPRDDKTPIRTAEQFADPKKAVNSKECINCAINDDWDDYDSLFYNAWLGGLPEAPLPDFPHIPDIPMRDQGDFQRVVVDVLRAIWARVSCTSRRTIRAHSPAEAGRARQRRDPSFESDDETELTTLTDHMSLIPNMMQNFLSLAIDRHGVDGIDRCARQRDSTKDAKVDQPVNYTHLPSLFERTKANLTQPLVLGLGIHGIRFFKQVWKVESEQDLVATTIKACFVRIPTKRIRTRLGGGNLQGSLHMNSWI
ncbi:hypothetical protein DY000_02031498 [Brassica cretica]|uniref:Uncharacterized protein n=1 Tax=Brassica cretica TaxID=69181 RepID=A0ABQ7DJ57_BRACR|nr:hypothetical protein DY000_02031498 [Brassica cretica]